MQCIKEKDKELEEEAMKPKFQEKSYTSMVSTLMADQN